MDDMIELKKDVETPGRNLTSIDNSMKGPPNTKTFQDINRDEEDHKTSNRSQNTISLRGSRIPKKT